MWIKYGSWFVCKGIAWADLSLVQAGCDCRKQGSGKHSQVGARLWMSLLIWGQSREPDILSPPFLFVRFALFPCPFCSFPFSSLHSSTFLSFSLLLMFFFFIMLFHFFLSHLIHYIRRKSHLFALLFPPVPFLPFPLSPLSFLHIPLFIFSLPCHFIYEFCFFTIFPLPLFSITTVIPFRLFPFLLFRSIRCLLFPFVSSCLFPSLTLNLRLPFASSQSKDYFSSLVNCCLVLSSFFFILPASLPATNISFSFMFYL